MKSHIYLDESGDLGWKFNNPYRDGGSSRYLTIGYLICDITSCNVPKRIVKDFYSKFGIASSIEFKASDLKPHHREFICNAAVKMMEKRPMFTLGAITVKKEKVLPHIRLDPNVLYNYMIGKAILDKIDSHDSCKITRDNRSVKVVSGKSCIDYLQTQIWMHRGKSTVLIDNPTHSHLDDGVIFIDWITNIAWTKHEDKYSKWSDSLKPYLVEQELFF